MNFINPPPLVFVGAALASPAAYLLFKRYVWKHESDVDRLQQPNDGHWLWGHEGQAFETSDQLYTDGAEVFGGAYTIKGALFHTDILVVTDPGAISHIFTKRTYNYVKGTLERYVNEQVVGKGLSWVEGEEHKRQRPMIAPFFTSEKVKAMEGKIRTSVDKLISSLQMHVLESSAEPGQSCQIDLVKWTCRATLDIIGSIGFGHDFQSGSTTEAMTIFHEWNRMVSLGLNWGGFVAAIFLRAAPFLVKLPLPLLEQQAQIRHIIRRLARDIVKERGELDDRKDLLSILLRTSKGEGDLDQILEQISTFVIAGHETIVTSMNFALYALATHKDVQDRLRQEIAEFIGSKGNQEPTYDDYQSYLPYLDAVCKESFRLYSPTSRLERVALSEDVLPLRNPVMSKDGTEMHSIRINKGQVVAVPSQAIGRSRAVWGPRAKEFWPERWLSPATLPAPSLLPRGWNGLFTFGEGPRMCVAHRLAIFEFKVLLTTLIKNFEFTDTGIPISTKCSVTVLQPILAGHEDQGVQLPIGIKLVT